MAGSSKKVIIAALVGNSLIAVSKFVAAALTGSAAMLSEAIHSLVDTGNQVLLLLGLRRAQKPADERFPYGHGKEIYFWGFIVAISIFAVGAGVSIYEGVRHLLHPGHIENPLVNYIVLSLAMVFEGAAWVFAFKEFSSIKGNRGFIEAVRMGKDPSTFIVLFEDTAAMLGLVVAFLGVWLGQVTGGLYWDGAASVVIGLILGVTAIWLAYETKSLLIGESADPEVVAGIRSLAAELPEVEHINEVLTTHFGPNFILANLSVDFDNLASAGQVERAVAQLDRQIKNRFPDVKKVFIEAEARSARGHEPGKDAE